MPDPPSFHRVKIRPFDCLRRGAQLVQGQYWLFFVLGLLTLVASQVPFYLVVGPFLVGATLAFRDRELGQEVTVQRFFEGFDRFLESMIVSLIYTGVALLVILPASMVVFLGAVSSAAIVEESGGSDEFVLAVVGVLVALLLLLIPLTYVFFSFAYQLVAERRMEAIAALKLSAEAARAHFVGLYLLWTVNLFITLAAFLACMLPMLFLLPIQMGSLYVAYRDVFGQPPPAE